VEWDGNQFPPPLGEIDDEWLTTWAEVADRGEMSVVLARLNDLLWERKFGERPDQRARTAIDSYFAMRESKEPMVAPDALVRALELARALHDTERAAEIATLVVDHARASIEGEEWEPGVALILIEAVIELPAAERPEGLNEVLEQVKNRYQAVRTSSSPRPNSKQPCIGTTRSRSKRYTQRRSSAFDKQPAKPLGSCALRISSTRSNSPGSTDSASRWRS
jgi:hypothetical protein